MRIIYGLQETHNTIPQFGGFRLVWQYAKLGVVSIVLKGL